jgi:hypothetical protein
LRLAGAPISSKCCRCGSVVFRTWRAILGRDFAASRRRRY